MMIPIYTQITQSVKITVVPEYQIDLSSVDEDHHVWIYNVALENIGEDTVQLLNRFWQIIDAKGRIQEVHGKGVIGKQPVLNPGDVFQYASQAHLQTSSGMMLGSYEMINEKNGVKYEAIIPAFSLDNPNEKIRPN